MIFIFLADANIDNKRLGFKNTYVNRDFLQSFQIDFQGIFRLIFNFSVDRITVLQTCQTLITQMGRTMTKIVLKRR